MKNLLALSFLFLAALTNPAHAGEGCAIAGPDNAPLTIEMYADLECSYCAKGSKTMHKVLRDYPGQVKLVFRNMPLPFHTNAITGAKAFSAICLQDPTLAYTFQSEIFHHQSRWEDEGDTYLYNTANKLGVDIDRMKADMAGTVVAKIIADDQQLAATHGFKGTPSFMIGTESVVGAVPYPELKATIDRQLGH